MSLSHCLLNQTYKSFVEKSTGAVEVALSVLVDSLLVGLLEFYGSDLGALEFCKPAEFLDSFITPTLFLVLLKLL